MLFDRLFPARCPITDDDRRWIHQRWRWLQKTFPDFVTRPAQPLCPTADDFPITIDGSEQSWREVFSIVLSNYRIMPGCAALEFYENEDPTRVGDVVLEGKHPRALGLYQDTDRPVISIDLAEPHDFTSITATMAHEIAHLKLLGGQHVQADESDHEPLTDLATVFFGLGIFTANSTIRESQWQSGGWQGWSVGGQGYLPQPVIAYGLALFAGLRQEHEPPWQSHLRLDARNTFKRSCRYLRRSEKLDPGGE